MHPNRAFRGVDTAADLAFVGSRGFGMLTLAGPHGPLASHIPFVVSAEGAAVNAHIVRSTPIRKALEDGPVAALLVVSGPDGYVSPDWYGAEDQVPTWNYVAVHLRGVLTVALRQGLRAHLDDLSASFEERLADKIPWTTAKMTPETLVKFVAMIVPITLSVARVDGAWKHSQNKPEDVRLRAADGVARSGIGSQTTALAALMCSGG